MGQETTALKKNAGYITVTLMDGPHELLGDTVDFMVKQEERHPGRLMDRDFRLYLDRWVLEMEKIYGYQMYHKLGEEVGHESVLRSPVFLDSISTHGWASPGVAGNSYLLELEAEVLLCQLIRLESQKKCLKKA